ncbi:MAG: hypothetical protein KF784_14760 [Fimbriimonadaceae bacterium]|nr:hypothetical protein [Fimbriimonadaceae bacterium]
MSKTVQNVKNSLKFKAQVKEGLLSVRVGVKKYTLPTSVRILSNGSHIFLSFTATSELFKVTNGALEAMSPKEDATEAFNALNPGKRRGRRRAQADVPKELSDALKHIPTGYKLVIDKDGTPRLAKRRHRKPRAK